MRAKAGRRGHALLSPLAAALTATLLLVGVGAVALHESDQAITQDALTRVESNRDAAIRAVQRQAADLERTISTFAADPAIIARLAHPSPATLAAAERQIALLAHSKGAAGIVLSDLGGITAGVFPVRHDLLGTDFSFRDWFKGAQRTGKPYVSAAYRSIAPGNPMAVGVSTPVTDHGRRVGYLTIVGQLDAVRAVAQQARNDDGVTMTVTDQTGQRLTGSLQVDSRGQPLTPSIDRATRAALAGRSISLVADDDLVSSARVPDVGWTVTASIPTSEALAPARAFRRSLGLSLGLSLLLLLGATAVAIRSTRRRASEHDDVEIERARLTALFAASPIGILECDADGTVVAVNEGLAMMLGYDVDELIGTKGTDLLQPDAVDAGREDMGLLLSGEIDRYSRDRLYRSKDGTLVPAHTSVILVHEHLLAKRRVVAFVVDQREQKRVEDALRASEDRLKELALHDDLTGLANRRLLLDRCTAAFASARRGGITSTTAAALFIDLDGFKPVNDLQGHERGDQVLVDIAADLLAVVRPTDTVARVGGDEFVVLLGSYEGVAHLHDVAERVTDAVRRQVSDGSTILAVTASVGVAAIDLALEPDARPDQLLGRADTAMYRAKELGRDRHNVYSVELTEVPRPRAERY